MPGGRSVQSHSQFPNRRAGSRRLISCFSWFACLIALACLASLARAEEKGQSSALPADEYAAHIRPLLQQYCYACHSAEKHKGSLNLERFESLSHVRRDLKPWESMVEMLEGGEMPPEGKRQPAANEREQILAWLHGFLNAEARARAGDPGAVPLRRLSNAEFNYTIRDLTGVDLQPTREFPADGAAGEGFTNAAEALADMSPALLGKYLGAAKEIAAHAVFLPDGLRFSPAKTHRDWTNEIMASLREFYAPFTSSDGRLPLEPYLAATLRYRDALFSGAITLEEAAAKEKLNARYLRTLWQALAGKEPSYPLDLIRAHWRQASEKDAAALAREISAWQASLWKIVKIGSYHDGNTRQVSNDPAAAQTQTLKLAIKPVGGQTDVVLYLAARELFAGGQGGQVVWHHPRFEGAGKPPLLLRDYAKFGPAYEVDYPALFADCPRYLAAAMAAAADPAVSIEDIAKRDNLDPALLKRWIALLDLPPSTPSTRPAQDPSTRPAQDPATRPAQAGSAQTPSKSGRENDETAARVVPAVPLTLLNEKTPVNLFQVAINGWRSKGNDLPFFVSNSSDTVEHIPGTAAPHKIVVHPLAANYVAAAWTSPVTGRLRVAAQIAHVHAGCGNGIAWWLEHRHGDRAVVLAEGLVRVFGRAEVLPRTVKIEKGDMLILAVDANGDYNCDLTQIDLTIGETAGANRVWDLAGDVADNIQESNPHADKLGHPNVWSFVQGPTRPIGSLKVSGSAIPADSVLGRWRTAAADPKKAAEAERLAEKAKAILSGARPAQEKSADRVLYDNLLSPYSVLLNGLDLSRYARAHSAKSAYGLPGETFGPHAQGAPVDDASVIAAADSVIEVRLPATLFLDYQFIVDVTPGAGAKDRVIDAEVLTTAPASDRPWSGSAGVVASAGGVNYQRLLDGFSRFRDCFPLFICYPHIIPVDEVVCLKQFHRDDEPLMRLFLDEKQKHRLDRLWEENRFVSQWPISENEYLPLFIGFVTQDRPKELVAYFEAMREPFRKRAEAFKTELHAAVPRQLEALLDFARRAYRRPLRETEKHELLGLFQALRDKGASDEDVLRGVLARVLVSPSFLFRLEQAPTGDQPAAVNDWELATRLSYFLWSTLPDEQLRTLADAGRLHDPAVLAGQTRRMLEDDRIRALAIEFGTQWIHVRGFDQFKEKNEKLFPTFDDSLRSAIYEESILFFQDLFQADEPITNLLDADYTYLNETLAKHYAIPGVTGENWQKVTGVKQYGRGGVLGLASVQAKTSGASRTSPVLRGNWVVETLLGEKLPRPPPDVPRLPEQEGSEIGLTTRQLVEKHTRVASCAVCHTRIDPFGFAFERYDPIGRLRLKESTGLAIDTRAKLKDGTEFDGIDGLRTYLLTKKKDVIVRLFCRRLLGYALGRSVTLSDQSTIDEMVAELNRNDGRLSAGVLTIVRSPQFRSIRGSAFTDE